MLAVGSSSERVAKKRSRARRNKPPPSSGSHIGVRGSSGSSSSESVSVSAELMGRLIRRAPAWVKSKLGGRKCLELAGGKGAIINGLTLSAARPYAAERGGRSGRP